MTSLRRSALVFAWYLAAALAAAQAGAQPRAPSPQELETARTLYKEGKGLRAQGDLRGALEKLQAAHALGNTPVTGIELARTYVMTGQIVEAREVALYIARMAVAPDETEKSAAARAEAATLAEQLRPRIPTLLTHVTGLAAGDEAHLAIDGASVPDAALAEAQKVDPGKHAVVVTVGKGAAARQCHAEVDIAEGQAAQVDVDVPPAPVPPVVPPLPPPPPPPAPRSHALERVGFAAAAVGAAVGALAGLTAITKTKQLAGECNAAGGCDGSNGGASDLRTARTWASVSTVAFVVGGAGAVLGIVGVVTGKPATQSSGGAAVVAPWIGLGAAGIDGRFWRVLVVLAATSGALAGCDVLIGLTQYHEVACAFDCGTDAAGDVQGDLTVPEASPLDAGPDAPLFEAGPPPEGGYPVPSPHLVWAHWPMPNPDAASAPESSIPLPNQMAYDAGVEGGSATVYDNVTQLTWWRTAYPATSLADGDSGAWETCAARGDGWRVPTRIELVSLVDFTRTNGAMIDPNAFPDAAAASYWTSSAVPGDDGPSGYWSVSLSTGLVAYSYDAPPAYVLCVSGGTQGAGPDACP